MAKFCPRWHLLGHRCPDCLYLPVPARFYAEFKGEKPVEVSHEKAEAAYLAWLLSAPEYVQPPVLQELVTEPRDETPNNVTRDKKDTRRGRPKKYENAAARQRAYRGRK